MSCYRIVFSGQVAPGAAAEQVRADLARLFRADAERIELLFSGRRITIKAGLTAAEAEKYRAALTRAGAQVTVEAEDAERTMTDSGHVAAASPEGPGSLQVEPRDVYMAAFAAVQAPDFGLAPAGADLQEARPEPSAPALDLTRFSLAPVGSDMGQVAAPPAGPPPDVSRLALEQP